MADALNEMQDLIVFEIHRASGLLSDLSKKGKRALDCRVGVPETYNAPKEPESLVQFAFQTASILS